MENPIISTILAGNDETDIEGLRAEIARLESRFDSFIDSEAESIFCYEPDTPIPANLDADEVAERFIHAHLAVANRTFARLRGQDDPGVFIGKPMSELAREALPRVKGLIKELIHAGNRHEGVEVQQRRPDGSVGTAKSNAHLVQTDGHYTRLWVILRDITAQKELEKQHELLQQQLRQAQRMESLGLLAGGIAHDFNNLLLVVDSCARFAANDLETDPNKARTSIRMIEEASARAAALIRSLMAFGRPDTGKKATGAVDVVVANLMETLRRLVPSRIDIRLDLNGDATVSVDQSQLEQIIVNLVINAADAIEGIGTINIATRLGGLTSAQRNLHPKARGSSFAEIIVSDTGSGIAPEVLPHIFEPYFTTKPEDKGNGLGLATVWTTANSHGGFVEVSSARGSGTEIRVFLPSHTDTPVPVPMTMSVPTPLIAGKTILVVDDHELVRNVTKVILERAGYRVIDAADGESALSIFGTHRDEIDGVVLDAVMPRLTGLEVYKVMRQHSPTLPIVFASGYTADVFDRNWVEATKPVMLPKPYDPAELLRVLGTLIGNRRQPGS